ncbi:hypothetical protein [Candidatus Cyanaurora vandensis]|uniref:hypothetical protein n=1 Tax=Candidatus Cyanaurora vandensis TaxID=2714958 RepID=UPI0025803E8A|nr:hypothetical protein [Candidatus Cyanaurora vandensis]
MRNQDWSSLGQGVDPASNRCRWRTLGLFLNAKKTLETIALLESLNIRPSDILVLTSDPPGSLPPVNWAPMTLAMPGLLLGLGLGLGIGVLGWVLGAGLILGLLGTLAWGILGAVVGWQVGVKRPRALVQPFWRDIHQGSYLVLIYATPGAHQRVLHPVRGIVGNLYEARGLVGSPGS